MGAALAVAVAALVVAAWYVTWATADVTMAVFVMPDAPVGGASLATAFVLLVVMMVAMMLPSALPMILAYRGITRLEHGEAVRPADRAGTAAFASAYFLVWGLFALVALLGLMFLGILGAMDGVVVWAPAAVLVAAGAYQFTRAKEACLHGCQSPLGFVMAHWRGGHRGAWRMGVHHALYCIGCCWLFMLVLFVAGAMSLVWMGAISVAIFVEKIGWRPVLVSRAIGVLLVVVGALFVARAMGLA